MPLAMPVVFSDRHRMHDPGGEVWVGVRTDGTELPARAERIREVLAGAGARIVEAKEPDEEALRAVHDPALIGWLRDAWGLWEEAGLDEDPGQDRVVPYLFAHPGLLGELPAIDPAATTAPAPITAPLSTIEPEETRAPSPMVAPSMCALCPTMQCSPNTVGSDSVQWTIVPSWMLVMAPTSMRP